MGIAIQIFSPDNYKNLVKQVKELLENRKVDYSYDKKFRIFTFEDTPENFFQYCIWAEEFNGDVVVKAV